MEHYHPISLQPIWSAPGRRDVVRRHVAGIIAAFVFSVPLSGIAAEEESPGQIQEVVVTAERKTERVQDVPASISAFSAEKLQRQEIHNLADVLPQVPSVTVTMPYGDGGPPNFSIRGITSTDYTPVQSKPIAIYVDEAIRDFQLFETMPIFDVDRIEVLRGPQGSLYGKNATAGAVNIVTAHPGFDTSGYATVGYGNFDRRSAQAAFQTPIVSGVLSARVALTYTKDDGVIKNRQPGVEDANQTDIRAERVELYFRPSDTFNATLRFNDWRSAGRNYAPLPTSIDFSNYPGLEAVPGINRAGVGFYETNQLTTPHRDIAGDEFNLQAEWKPTELYKLTSISEYAWGRWNDVNDSGAGLPLVQWDAANTYVSGAHQFVQELRAASEYTGPFNWLGGLSYSSDEISTGFGYAFLADPRCGASCDFGFGLGGIGEFESAQLRQKRRNIAEYIRGEYQIVSSLKVTAGVRHSHDTLSVPFYNAQLGDSACTACIPTIVNESRNAAFNNTSAELVADVTFTKNFHAYASFKQGYRTGAVNDQAFLSPDELSIAPPETVNAYEVGLKSTLLNRTLSINLAIFENDYRNQQIISAEGTIFPLVSVPRSRIRGLEFDVNSRINQFVSFNVSAGFIDPQYERGVVNGTDIAGNQITGAAKISGSAGLDLTLPVNGNSSVNLNLLETYSSRVFNDSFQTAVIAQPTQWLTNGRLWYQSDRVSVAAYAKNLFNLKSYTYALGIQSTFGYNWMQRINPRTFGVEATYHF
jgi:iron complex outermembrane recepter protein